MIFLTPLKPFTPPLGVDLWYLDLTKCDQMSLQTYSEFLPIDELERAQQYRKSQTQFLFTRLFLRKVIAHYTGWPTQEITIARTAHGKPFLLNAPTPLYFNLSHTSNSAILAVTTYGEVGVDIEAIRQRDFLKIAERYFHADESQQLQSCNSTERATLFFKLWTLKEAFFKATGSGISTGLNKVHFNLSGDIITPSIDPSLNRFAEDWQFQQHLIENSLVAALVVESNKPLTSRWFYGKDLPGLD